MAGVCFLAAGGLRAAPVSVDGIAAVVNDDIITYTDIDKMVGRNIDVLLKSYERSDPVLLEKIQQTRKDALDQLIDRQLILQHFNAGPGKKPENLKLLDRMVEDQIQEMIDLDYGGDRSVFIKSLEAHGMNLENFKERKRDELTVRILLEEEIRDEIIISPYKLEQYYKQHPDEFKENERVKLQLVYIPKGGTPEEEAGARSMAKELLLKLTTGSDFATMASVYSEDSSKNSGGEFGFVRREDIREELREKAFSLDAGDLSPVIDTKDGLYILKILDRQEARVIPLDEARPRIERRLVESERERIQNRWLQSLKRRAYIRTY